MTSRRGIGIRRLLHWEVGVRDLERTVAFFEALTPFRAGGTATSDDDRSVLLLNGDATPRLRLVETREAAGVPHDSLGASGFVRIVLHVADLAAARTEAERLGFPPVAPTTGDAFRFELGSRGLASYRVWACLDPDGIVVEFLEDPVPKVSTVASGTRDLAAATAFLAGVLGLELTDTVRTPAPVPNVYLPGGAPVEFTGAFFRAPDPRGYLDVLEHRDPALRRDAYPPGHGVGVLGAAFEVEDLAVAIEALTERGVPVDDPADVELGAPLGRRRSLGIRDPEGVAYRLVSPG